MTVPVPPALSAAAAQPGALWAWGANHLGQMGSGPGLDQWTPQPVPGVPQVRSVCANASAVLALDGQCRVWSWGWNTGGMLGRGRPADEKAHWLPTALRDRGHPGIAPAGNPPNTPGLTLTPAQEHCESAEEGADGGSDEGTDAAFDAELQAFLASIPVHISPVLVMEGVCTPGLLSGLPPVRQIAMGSDNGFALDDNGAVWAWGAGGRMGTPVPKGLALPEPAPTPVQVAGLPPVLAIVAHPTGDAVYALDAQGVVWSWGNGYEGELGQGKRRTDPVPAPITGLAPVRSIHALGFAALAVLTDGRVFGWGSTESGLGFEALRKNTWRVMAPVPVGGLPGPVRSVWVGHGMAVYRLDDGSTWACGVGLRDMYPGSVGEPPRVPRRQTDLDLFVDFFLGDRHGFALDAAGGVHGFGRVESGALGQGEHAADVLRDWAPITLLPHPVTTMAAAGHHSLAVCAAG